MMYVKISSSFSRELELLLFQVDEEGEIYQHLEEAKQSTIKAVQVLQYS